MGQEQQFLEPWPPWHNQQRGTCLVENGTDSGRAFGGGINAVVFLGDLTPGIQRNTVLPQ